MSDKKSGRAGNPMDARQPHEATSTRVDGSRACEVPAEFTALRDFLAVPEITKVGTCEWDPARNAPATVGGGCPNDAVWSVGPSMGNFHLCASCVELKRFEKFRKRTWIGPRDERPEGA